MSNEKYFIPTMGLHEHYNSWDELLDDTVEDILSPVERIREIMKKYTAPVKKIDLFDLNVPTDDLFNLNVSVESVLRADTIISITQSIGRANRYGTANRIPITINRYTPD